jgi:hypothetical protein
LSTLEYPQCSAAGLPGEYPVVVCAGLAAAVHAHRHDQWQIGHGFLGLPNRTGCRSCKARREGPPAQLRIGEARGKTHRGDERVRCASKAPARRVGPDGRRAVREGSVAEGRSRAATCARRRAARRAWQRSVRRRAGHGIAWQWHGMASHGMAWHGMAMGPPRRALGGHATAVFRVHEGASRATRTANRSMHASLRGRALHCSCCWLASHGHQGRRAASGCTSMAVAVASACGDKTSRRIGRRTGRLLGGEWGKDSGWGVGVAGRTSTGATCAISASKRGSSGAHASPLYVQCTLANTRAKPFGSSCSNTSYSVSPSA